MKGSMELLADRDPEDARKLLDPVIEYMMESVHRYEGTVSNLMDDGIMALFGAPLAHEDHAVRACYAALRMQDRVGLNSGEVVVGSIGNDLKMNYTAVGQTAHLAARMEQMGLSRLRQSKGKRAGAQKLVAEIYDWFTEGFDTADLKEAKALLEALS